VTWWCPDPRAIFDLDSFQVSRSLRKTIRQSGWTFHLDRDFKGTMERCAEATDDRPSTWISKDFVASYCELHRRGLAHSVEVYEKDEEVGGLYGVAFGGFFGANPCSGGDPTLQRPRSPTWLHTCVFVASFCLMRRS